MTDGRDDGLERDLEAIHRLQQQDQPPPQPGPEAGGTATGAQPASAPTPPPRKVRIGDEEFDEAEVLQWRRGHLRLQDYTKKTQQIAEERRRLQATMQQVQPLLAMQQVLAANPHLQAAFQQAWQQALQQAGSQRPVVPPPPMPGLGVAGPMAGGPVADPVVEKVYQLEAEIELDKALAALRERANEDRRRLGMEPLSEADWKALHDEVLMAFLNDQAPGIQEAYREIVYPRWLEQRAKALEAHRQQAQQVAASTLRGSPPAASPTPPVPRDFSEATRLAAQDPSVRGRLWVG